MTYNCNIYPNVTAYLGGYAPRYDYPQVGEYRPNGIWIVAKSIRTKCHLVDRAMLAWSQDGQATVAARAKCGAISVETRFAMEPIGTDFCDECLFNTGFEGRRGPFVVYRFLDAGGQVLYIGYSSRLLKRLAMHMKAPWWHEVADASYIEYDDELDARRAERDAIEAESPKHNVLGVVYGRRSPAA